VLSRGIQHSQLAVAHSTLLLMITSLSAAAPVLEAVSGTNVRGTSESAHVPHLCAAALPERMRKWACACAPGCLCEGAPQGVRTSGGASVYVHCM